jgi:dTDP-4-dehydrorhamnose reductase
MKYLIAGRNGQLAREFIKTFEARSIDFSAPEESRLDITDSKRVSEVVDAYRPDVIINCAAHNLVDRAEQQKDVAFAVNAIGPRNLARVAAKQKILLVHFSSDYVFDGAKENGLYDENDAVNPVNVYGESKLTGEKHVQEELERLMILRLSWVFGEGEQNFIHKVREWSKKNDFLKITCDEFSVPTYTGTVVDVTMRALSQGVTGLYHLTNSGFCSRYEWAKLILGNLGITKFIRPVTLDEFHLPAVRPKFSAMSNKKIAGLLNVEIPTWEAEVISFLRKS